MSKDVEVAKLQAVLEARTEQFNAGMSQAEKAFDKLDEAAKASQDKLEKMTSLFTKFGIGLTAGVTAPILLAARTAVMAASDLNESINKTSVVFEAATQSILNWARTSVDSVGLAEKAALEGASSLGALMKSQGLASKATAELSMRLVQLAADARSLYNLRSVEESLSKFQAALIGEFMPLRQLGIVLNQDMIKAEALAQGLIKAGDALTGYARVVATVSLIEKQGAVFAGDFSRTKDELANSLVRLQAEMQNVYTTLGKNLLPAVLDGTRTFLSLVKAVNELPPAVIENAVKFALLAAAIGPALLVAGRITNVFIAQRTALAALEAGQETFANVMQGSVVPALTVAGLAFAGTLASLEMLDTKLQKLTATMGKIDDVTVEAMLKNKEAFELQADYLQKLLDSQNLSGERWKFSREQTEENARAILRLIQSARDYGQETRAVAEAERMARQEQLHGVANVLIQRGAENKALREKYGILTRGESQEAMRQMEKEFATLAKNGVALQEMSKKFLPDFTDAVKRHAESYGEAEIPKKIGEIIKAWDEAQKGQPQKLQEMIDAMSGATSQAVEQAEPRVMEWGQRLGKKLSGGFGMAVEEGMSYGEQAMKRWAEEVKERLPIVLKVELDTAGAEQQLSDLAGRL